MLLVQGGNCYAAFLPHCDALPLQVCDFTASKVADDPKIQERDFSAYGGKFKLS